jgi:hypothetical protein
MEPTTAKNTFYNDQYRRIQEGALYMILNGGNIKAKTHAGKYEAIYEVILRNTIMLSEISVASKHLVIATDTSCQIEISYFKRLLAFHCYDLLYPTEGGTIQFIMIMLRKFNNDLVKPKKKLDEILKQRSKIIGINRTHFPYFKRLKHRVVLTKRKGTALQQYQVIDSINAQEVLSICEGFIEVFIQLNTLLVDLLQHLNSSNNKYSGDNH